MNSNTDSSLEVPKLDNLPAEILYNILHNLRSSHQVELRNLRRTCKALANAATVHLIKKINVLIETDRLRNLQRCSEHPLIGQCITHIVVGGARLRLDYYLRACRLKLRLNCTKQEAEIIRALREEADAPIEDCQEKHPPNDGDEPQHDRLEGDRASMHGRTEKRRARAVQMLGYISYQEQLKIPGLPISLLSQAFARIPKLQIVEFSDAWINQSYGNPARMIYEHGLVVLSEESWRCHVSHVTIQALSRAHCQPQALIFNWLGRIYGLPGQWGASGIRSFLPSTRMTCIAQNLRLLRVEPVCSSRNIDIYQLDPFIADGSMGRCIETLTQLEELSLRFHGLQGASMTSLTGCVKSARLRYLRLEGIEFGFDDLETWLMLHADSLITVELQGLMLKDYNWCRLVNCMRAMSFNNLQSLRLSHLYSCDELEGLRIEQYRESDQQRRLSEYVQGKIDILCPPATEPINYSTNTGPYCVMAVSFMDWL